MAKNVNTREVVEHNVRTWLAALESGTFAQVTGALEKENRGFCCLGVACKVLGAERYLRESDGEIQYDGEHDYLPETIRKKLGLGDSNPAVALFVSDGFKFDTEHVVPVGQEYTSKAEYITLSALNDNYSLDFKQIAKVIRLNKNRLFRYKDMEI